jgi:hypothetical protein
MRMAKVLWAGGFDCIIGIEYKTEKSKAADNGRRL